MSKVSEVQAIIKNTFLEFVDEEASAAAGGGLCRTSSCPCIRAHYASPDDGAYSEDDSSACPWLSSLGSWADVTDDVTETEEEDSSSCCASADLKPWSRSVSPLEAEEKKPALAQALTSARTPLSSKASAFSAFAPTPLSSKASAFVPGLGACEQPSCSPEQASAPDTTVLMRNLPPDLTRAMLTKGMKKKGFAGLYDFVHLPLEGHSNKCLGYAYVSLSTMKHKQRFTEVFHGFKGWPVSSSKGCSIAGSQAPGASANAEASWKSPVAGAAVPGSSEKKVFFAGSTGERPKGKRRR